MIIFYGKKLTWVREQTKLRDKYSENYHSLKIGNCKRKSLRNSTKEITRGIEEIEKGAGKKKGS